MNLTRFVDELKKLDRKLDCRYNQLKCQYEVTHMGDSGPYILHQIPMGFLASQAKAVLTGIMKARQINPKEKLRQIEEEEAREEKLADKKLSEDAECASAEGYDTFKRLEGQRITLSDVPFHVTDRRRILPETI